jgi:hypothetical protein
MHAVRIFTIIYSQSILKHRRFSSPLQTSWRKLEKLLLIETLEMLSRFSLFIYLHYSFIYLYTLRRSFDFSFANLQSIFSLPNAIKCDSVALVMRVNEWMFMTAMVRIFSWGKRWNVLWWKFKIWHLVRIK